MKELLFKTGVGAMAAVLLIGCIGMLLGLQAGLISPPKPRPRAERAVEVGTAVARSPHHQAHPVNRHLAFIDFLLRAHESLEQDLETNLVTDEFRTKARTEQAELARMMQIEVDELIAETIVGGGTKEQALAKVPERAKKMLGMN